jgi:hypothetical protein
MLRENLTQQSRSSLRHRVNFLNQLKDVRGHEQQISNRAWTRVPIRMRFAPPYEHGRACLTLSSS